MWSMPPVDYIEPLFRPPSEARSLILQVTNGCSWNQCGFCEMYTAEQKKFKPKKESIVLDEIRACGLEMPDTRRIFLADGDAMALSFRRLETILTAIQSHFSKISRITAYCLPRNLKNKTVEDLVALRELGLTMVYIGVETGDDDILSTIHKGETYETTRVAMDKLKAAGIKRSVMIINGIGGRHFSAQHIENTARLMNDVQPEYLASLVLFFSKGDARYRQLFKGQFDPLDTVAQLQELQAIVRALDLKSTIFRSDHASNLLPLKGVLGKDKARLLTELDQAIRYCESQAFYSQR